MGICAICNDEIKNPVYREGSLWYCSLDCANIGDGGFEPVKYDPEKQHHQSLKHAVKERSKNTD